MLPYKLRTSGYEVDGYYSTNSMETSSMKETYYVPPEPTGPVFEKLRIGVFVWELTIAYAMLPDGPYLTYKNASDCNDDQLNVSKI